MKWTAALFAALLLVPAAPAKEPKPPKPPKTKPMESLERAQFRISHSCPATGKTEGPCPGYVIAYIQAPQKGGEHNVMNMQWLSTAEAKGKTPVK